jgi:predicted nucleotidyltransferase
MQLNDHLFYKKIAALPFVDAIYLFGSTARGDHLDRSDLDIAILCPNANERDWPSILQRFDDADTRLSIDCIRLDQESQNSTLRLQIEQDKKLIYERRT